jgi:AcrR family transcriptional regulator
MVSMIKKAARKGHTRIKMIQTALDLFHQQGVNATSVDEVLAKSGTGKSQFYHYFKSKEGLVHAVLQHFYEMLKSNQLPVKNEIESWEDLEHWFRFFITAQKGMQCERSCPIGTIGNDLSNSQDLLRQDVRLIFQFTRHSLARFFSGTKAKGEIPATVDPDALADFCFSIMQGGLLVAKIQRESAPFENAVAHALAYLKSLRT